MEYGIRLVTPHALARDPRDLCPAAPAGTLPEGPVTALYFGTEFCEDLLPSAAEATAYCALARDGGFKATLLTPVVTTEGLGAVERLLDELVAGGWVPDVVFNDWGVMRVLRERHPRLSARAGRLLNRALRDPRAFVGGARGASPTGFDAARGVRLRRLLARCGVEALETDPDLDGGYLGDGSAGLHRALHLPYALAASGRNCLFKATALPGRGIGQLLADPCPRPCRDGPARADRTDCAFPLWRAGNTLVYEVPWEAAQAYLAEADRIVLHEAPSP